MHLCIVSQVALQVGFLKHLGDVVHSSSGLSQSQFVLFLHVIPDRLMMMRSDLCVEHWMLTDKNLTRLFQLMAK